MMAWPALFFSINSLINQHSLRTKDGGQSPWSGVLCVYIIICHNAHAHYVYLYQYGCSCTDCSPYAQVHGYYSAVSTGVIPLISTFIESTSLRAYTREQGRSTLSWILLELVVYVMLRIPPISPPLMFIF